MTDIGTLKEVEKVFKNYKMEILGLSETRWNGFGEFTTQEGNSFIYSGHQDENGAASYGVGILMSKTARKGLLDWTPVSERLITARFKSKVRNISIVQCYAPTNKATVEDKDAFYEQLENVFRKIKKQDIIMLIGDLNAKVGADNHGLEKVMGKHGLGVRNDNGERLIEFCRNYDLVIGGTLFPHKDCHKITWKSPDCITTNQIDHIAISRKWRRSLLDTRNKRGAHCGSDHHLVVASIRLKVAAKQTMAEKRKGRYDVGKLKNNTVKGEFNTELSNRFYTLQMGNNETINCKWNKTKDTFNKTCEDVLGTTRKQKEPWVSDNTWKLIEERNKLGQRRLQTLDVTEERSIRAEYYRKHKEVKRSFRKDRRDWAENLAKEAEQAAEQSDIRKLYSITKTLANKKSFIKKPVKNKDNQNVVVTEDQLQIWAEYFKELLNRDMPDSNVIGGNDEVLLECDPRINSNPPSRSEIIKAVKDLKNGKSPGIDNIPPEVLKACPETTAAMLQPLLEEIWHKETLPEDWQTGLLVKIPKKGDLTLCGNWRGITLLSIPSKILTKIILYRIQNVVDENLRKEQAGFRRNRSCVDMINTLRIIIEQSAEYQAPLYLTFVDFEKAFDSLSRDAIWKALHKFKIPQKLINIIKATYDNYSCRVIHEGKVSDPFQVQTGVKQGCQISPIIFLMVLDGVMRRVITTPRGIQWRLTQQIEDLDFADDICFMSHKIEDMKGKIQDLKNEGRKVGLKINTSKTKEMRINCKINTPLTVDSEIIESVDQFQYLGSIVDKQGGSDIDVDQRIRKAKGAFAQLMPIWRCKELRTGTKLRIFQSNVKSVLLYGCQTWRVTQAISKKLQTFINSCLRRILKIFWPNVIPNHELWSKTNQEPVATTIKKRKFGWIGHTLRKSPDDISRQTLDWNPQGRRKPGRPRITWRRTVEKEVKDEGKSWGEVKHLAQNRVRWRSFVAALCPPTG
uniref:Craniofacial development protein 2 n=1 Tax=Cacopsylla melanoneura TaxID=428564 RepID=A0A8D8XXM4_9HEMI